MKKNKELAKLQDKIAEETGFRRAEYHYPDHKKPITRRDFIGLGMANGIALYGLPTLLDLVIAREVRADGGVFRDSAEPFVITFDIDNGSTIPAQFCFAPLDQDGQIPTTYNFGTLGVAAAAPTTDRYGVRMYEGRFLATLDAKLPQEIRDCLSIAHIQSVCNDDTRSNANGVVNRVVNVYRNVANKSQVLLNTSVSAVPGGFSMTNSGVYASSPDLEAGVSVLGMQAADSLKNALIAGVPGLSLPQSTSIMAMIAGLAGSEKKRRETIKAVQEEIDQARSAQLAANNVGSNYVAAASLDLSPAVQLNAATNAILNTPANFPDAGGGEVQKFGAALAAARYNAIPRTFALVVSGGDHHNGSSNAQNGGGSSDNMAMRVANYISAAALTAREAGVPLVVNIITAGGQNGTPWVSDEGRFNGAAQLVFAKSTATKPEPFVNGARKYKLGYAQANGFNQGSTLPTINNGVTYPGSPVGTALNQGLALAYNAMLALGDPQANERFRTIAGSLASNFANLDDIRLYKS